MKKNDTISLCDELFATLRGVKDGTVELDKAKQIVNISNAIVSVGKLELEAIGKLGEQYQFGIGRKVGSENWLENKSQENIKTITAKTKEDLHIEMQNFTNSNKNRSPELLKTKWLSEQDIWIAQYRLTN